MDLKRNLLIRITLFAALLFCLAVALVLQQAQQRVQRNIEVTGSTIQQLISDDIAHHGDAFHRSIDDVELRSLNAIGQLLHFCVDIENLDARPVSTRCFTASGTAPALLQWAMARVLGDDIRYHGRLGNYPGIKVGELAVRPDVASEAADAWQQIRLLAWISGGVLLLNLLVYVPVRRALRPTEHILTALTRLENGDLDVRLPAFPLIELQRISAVFNHLAAQLQKTMGEQQQLAARLLSIREDERRHLARELHDELGQYLASIKAEAAFAGGRASQHLPDLLPCIEAIARSTGCMMESLQKILTRLRPIGLEAFGLAAGLQQLVDDWNQLRHGQCRYQLEVHGDYSDLPPNLNISLYRIVQESLTNATRHGQAQLVCVCLHRGDRLELRIEDDGRHQAATPPQPGRGLLGMHERVMALGGSLHLQARLPQGMAVLVSIPLNAPATVPATSSEAQA